MFNAGTTHTPATLAAARRRGIAHATQTKRDPDTGRAWWLYCGYEQFVEYLLRVEAELGIVHTSHPEAA